RRFARRRAATSTGSAARSGGRIRVLYGPAGHGMLLRIPDRPGCVCASARGAGMRSLRWHRTMPLTGRRVAALAAFGGGGSGDDPDDDRRPPANTGGTGGDAGGGGGGAGGDGGTPVTPCEDHDDCQAWERCDEKEKICVPKCTRDRECGLNTGLRCDTETGLCVPGEPCDQSFNCGTHRDFDYCKTARCYCQPDESMQNGDPPRNGVCWRLSSICSECESDEECEGGSSGVCVPYNYNDETRNVCLRKPS